MWDPDEVRAEQMGKAHQRQADRILASAAHFLIQGGENDAAILLLFCDLDFLDSINGHTHVTLYGPRIAFDVLDDGMTDQSLAVDRAFRAVIGKKCDGFDIQARMVEIGDPDWRAALLESAHGRGVHNQGVEIQDRKIVTWGLLRFRSESEVRIARALDAAGVLFLPNCLARVEVGQDKRATREADFLVCLNGKWGILEVDGPFHPRAVVDHERDRAFRGHRIKVIERFDWEECYKDATGVVQRFLTLLDKNG